MTETADPGTRTRVTSRRARSLAPTARAGPTFVVLVLVVSAVPWRPKTYFEGALDWVVLAKAMLSILAVGLAYGVSAGRPRRTVAAYPWIYASAYLCCTMLGACAIGDLVPSLVLAVRVVTMLVVVSVLAGAFSQSDLLASMVGALALLGGFAALTGVGSLASGRLRGGLPSIHPNELAFLAVVVVLWCLAVMAAGRDRWLDAVGVGLGVAVLLGTGSRTSLAAGSVAAGAVVLGASMVRVRTFVGALVVVPGVAIVAVASGALTQIVTRGGSAADLTTLSNRTIAWEAALTAPGTSWQLWFGAGLSRKHVDVPGQWWAQQILDSSWVSALVQGGLFGTLACLLLVAHAAGRLLRIDGRLRTFAVAVLLFLVLQSLLESGLFDASAAFIVLLCLTLPTVDVWERV